MANEVITSEVSLESRTNAIIKNANSVIDEAIKGGSMSIPDGYDINNELTTACLMLSKIHNSKGKPIGLANPNSVVLALRVMVSNGLSMGRKQCYGIMYGDDLTIMPSYFGTLTIMDRLFPKYKVVASVIRKGEKYSIFHNSVTGCHQLVLAPDNRITMDMLDAEIEGAYGYIMEKKTNEVVYSEVMSMKEILKCWSHAKTDKVQKEFPDQMAKRTLINRMCKTFINAGNPSNPILAKNYNELVDNEYMNEIEASSVVTDDKKIEIRKKSKGVEGLKKLIKKSQNASQDLDSEDVDKVEVVNMETGEITETVAPAVEVSSEEIPF